jgi:hypothetical protein
MKPAGATRAPTTRRYAALLLLALACLLLPAARGVETLVFSHRVSGGVVAAEYFASTAEALSVAGDVSAPTHKFSRLSELEAMRRADGLFQFRLVYPTLATPNENTFVQSSNPATAAIVSGYAAISTPLFGVATGAGWGGLRLSDASQMSLIDGSSGSCCGWYALGYRGGPYNWAGGSGLPAVAEVNVLPWVQLWVSVSSAMRGFALMCDDQRMQR